MPLATLLAQRNDLKEKARLLKDYFNFTGSLPRGEESRRLLAEIGNRIVRR